jgi:hypothetical protein
MIDKVLFTGGVVGAFILWQFDHCPEAWFSGSCLSPVGHVGLWISVGCAAWGLVSLLTRRSP